MASPIKGNKMGKALNRAPVPIDAYDNKVDAQARDDINKYRPGYTQGNAAKPQAEGKAPAQNAVGKAFNPCRS
jgi:hypothetical protein